MRSKCIKCGAPAVWIYGPDVSIAYCDKHVPRGCSCTVDPDTGLEDLDDRGRMLPCCEYLFDNSCEIC